jgi:phosphoribosylanthranilate isomerase
VIGPPRRKCFSNAAFARDFRFGGGSPRRSYRRQARRHQSLRRRYSALITYLSRRAIAAFCHALGADLATSWRHRYAELKRLKLSIELTALKVWCRNATTKVEAMLSELSPLVDAFITDTFDPKTGASGATGKTHDWRVSRRLAELTDRPIILAGGLTPQNVKRAILEVRPAGVDSHTGVEDTTGRKSREKVQKFLSEAYEAFALVKAK